MGAFEGASAETDSFKVSQHSPVTGGIHCDANCPGPRPRSTVAIAKIQSQPSSRPMHNGQSELLENGPPQPDTVGGTMRFQEFPANIDVQLCLHWVDPNKFRFANVN